MEFRADGRLLGRRGVFPAIAKEDHDVHVVMVRITPVTEPTVRVALVLDGEGGVDHLRPVGDFALEVADDMEGDAQAIGLLPDISSKRVELCGNTALAGCERLLMSPTGATDLLSLRSRATVINLSGVSDFDSMFMENLFLQPMKVDET